MILQILVYGFTEISCHAAFIPKKSGIYLAINHD